MPELAADLPGDFTEELPEEKEATGRPEEEHADLSVENVTPRGAEVESDPVSTGALEGGSSAKGSRSGGSLLARYSLSAFLSLPLTLAPPLDGFVEADEPRSPTSGRNLPTGHTVPFFSRFDKGRGGVTTILSPLSFLFFFMGVSG